MSNHFSSSALVRLLAERTGLAGGGTGTGEHDFAERLSQWLGTLDAIALRGAQQLPDPAGEAWAGPERAMALQRLLQRVRGALLRGFADVNAAALAAAQAGQGPATLPGMRLPAGIAKYIDVTELPGGDETYAAFRQRYLDQQRQMETKIAGLREHVRQQLHTASPRLRQLAALDAAMDRMLDSRRQKLLAQVPVHLERRFEQLRESDALARAGLPAPEPGAAWRAGGWLHGFAREWEEALVAELEVRLQPVVGLIEACGHELKGFE